MSPTAVLKRFVVRGIGRVTTLAKETRKGIYYRVRETPQGRRLLQKAEFIRSPRDHQSRRDTAQSYVARAAAPVMESAKGFGLTSVEKFENFSAVVETARCLFEKKKALIDEELASFPTWDDITQQFLIETVVLSSVGGLLGVVIGIGIPQLIHYFVPDTKVATTVSSVLLSFGISVFVVLDEGKIVDTIINALVTPLAQLPVALYAMGISVMQTLLAVPVPSSSGRVTLTLPILVPLSDLLGLSRQATVTATQYGPGIVGQFLPTDGALMAVLAVAGVRFERWLKFCLPVCAVLFVYGLAAVALAAFLNVQ